MALDGSFGAGGRVEPRFLPGASVPDLPWHVVYTKPQKELRCEMKLRSEGAAAWLPLESKRFGPGLSDRKFVPVFPRYLFMQMTGERLRWGYVIRTEGGEELASVVRSPSGKPLEVPPADMEVLFQQCAPNGVIYPVEQREMRRGDKGQVLTGPFVGFRGICTRTTRERVWLLLSVLGRREVEFSREVVELAS